MAAHLGLLAWSPPARPPAPNPITVPLALFTPGTGIAQPGPAESGGGPAGADEEPGTRDEVDRPARSRRGPAAASEATGVEAPGAAPESGADPGDPGALDALEAGSGGESADDFLDRLMEGSGPRRPQPGACPDPVLGTWRARRYDPVQGKRAEFLLRVTEREGERVRGRITLRAWSGDTESPPRCAPGSWFHTVRMPATGRFEDGRLRFDALSFQRVSHCSDPGFAYNLDHFTGTVSGDGLRAVNNDGGHEVDTPYRFQRIACH
ncbi:MAG: hypothetical protein CMN30_24755 [Sandaracinus sp.]|nr:hypothetical protein [Sandaracinus sp.]